MPMDFYSVQPRAIPRLVKEIYSTFPRLETSNKQGNTALLPKTHGEMVSLQFSQFQGVILVTEVAKLAVH